MEIDVSLTMSNEVEDDGDYKFNLDNFGYKMGIKTNLCPNKQIFYLQKSFRWFTPSSNRKRLSRYILPY